MGLKTDLGVLQTDQQYMCMCYFYMWFESIWSSFTLIENGFLWHHWSVAAGLIPDPVCAGCGTLNSSNPQSSCVCVCMSVLNIITLHQHHYTATGQVSGHVFVSLHPLIVRQCVRAAAQCAIVRAASALLWHPWAQSPRPALQINSNRQAGRSCTMIIMSRLIISAQAHLTTPQEWSHWLI